MKKLTKVILSITVLTISTLLLTGCKESPEKIAQYENIVEEADLLYDGRSYTEALSRYEEATKTIPSRIDAYRGIVNIFLDKGRLEDAKDVVENSTQKLSQSDKSILFSLVGNEYFEIGDYTKALEAYENATTLGVNNLVATLGKAKVYIKQNKVSDAEKLLKGSNFEEDTLYEAKLLYSYTQSLTDTESALEILEAVTPSEDWSAKYSEFNNILSSIDEDQLYNATKLSQVFINEGYPYLATTLLSPLEEGMSEYPDGLYFLGRALADIGSYDSALSKLQGAISAGSLDSDVFRTMARVYKEKGEMDSTISYYDRAVAYAGEEITESLTKEYLNFLLEENLLTKAQEVLKIAQKYHEQAWVNILAIEVSYLLEDYEKLSYYVDQALEDEIITTEEKKQVYYWSSVRAFEENDLQETKEILSTLKELDRYNPYYHLMIGKVYYQEGDFTNSKESLELAIEYDLGQGVAQEAEIALARVN